MDGSGALAVIHSVAATATVALLGSYVVGWLVARFGVAIAMRRARVVAGGDWVERARLAYPARRVIGVDLLVVPLSEGALIANWVAPSTGSGPGLWAFLGGLAGLLGVLSVGRGLEGRLCRGTTRPEGTAASGISLTSFLLLPGIVPFALMMAVMPTRWGWASASVLAAGAAASTFHVAGGWLIPLGWLGLAKPASPRLEAVVGRAAGRVGVRPRASIELASPQANALAWPVPRLLVFTGPILEVLDDDELAAIAAHELGHLAEPRGVLLVRLATAYLPVALTSAGPLIGSFGLLVGLAPLAVLVLVVIVSQRVGRRMEERSDRIGREHEGEAVGTYARALAVIHEANLIPVVLPGKRQVHPHLYDRLIAAGAAPDYPRPSPPPRVGLASLPAWLLASAAIWAILSGLETPGPRDFPAELRRPIAPPLGEVASLGV